MISKRCDKNCYTAECGYDGGDCDQNCTGYNFCFAFSDL